MKIVENSQRRKSKFLDQKIKTIDQFWLKDENDWSRRRNDIKKEWLYEI